MPRKREIRKREVLPDPKYHDPLVAKFINGLMRRGKKSVAESIFYGALTMIQDRIKSDPMKTFKQAMDNVKPVLEVRPRRVGGATYQVPVEVRPERKMALCIRWIIGYAKAAGGKDDGGEAFRRVDRCSQQSGGSDQEERGYAQDGRGQQGLCSLSLVILLEPNLNAKIQMSIQ